MKGVLKMVNYEEPDNRQILTLPGPYKQDCTPYNNADFCVVTKDICNSGAYDIISNLKVSKVIILGDLSVGKTCIVNRFCRHIFETGYKATIGVDFEVERFDILNMPFHLQIWDTAGQERFKSIAQSYYRCAHVIVVVFDFTSINTLAHSKKWLNEALGASGNDNPFLFLVGSKADLVSKAAFENIEMSAMKFANTLGMEYWSVSSRTGENISAFFYRIAALAFDRIIANEKEKIDVMICSEPMYIKKIKEDKKIMQTCSENKCKNS